MMRIGIYGGSFNPPHLGHVRAAHFFQQSLALDRLHIIPAGRVPLRAPLTGASGEDRLALCKLSFPYPVSDIELRRTGVSYTIDTLRQLQRSAPQAQWFLLIGSDQLEKFSQWHCSGEILERCTVCALQRDEGELHTSLPIRLLSGFAPLEVSATQLREGLAQGEDVSRWLAPQALAYIQEKGLYAV